MRQLPIFPALAFTALLAAQPIRGAASASPHASPHANPPSFLLPSRIGAEVDGAWLYSTGYPSHRQIESTIHDGLGTATAFSIRYSGWAGAPDLVWQMKRYRDRAFSSVQVQVDNTTARQIHVSRIRLFEGEGRTIAALGGRLAKTRVLSDSYSEDTPIVRIHNFDDAPHGAHLAVGSQLLYNSDSGNSLFAGALTSKRWLTVFHLRPESYTIDDEGTTELTATKSLQPSHPNDYVTLKVSVPPGGHLDSEELLVAEGRDYLQTLRDYADAVRIVNHARVTARAPWGWWSWTAYYYGVSEGLALTNASWLAAHLEHYGYSYLHLDEGYDATRGDYTIPDPSRFPKGLAHLARTITRKGLTLGLWTAPFEVSANSWVYWHHKDWLVKNPKGDPIWLGKQKGAESIYALDPTNPGAQAYLRETYQTLAHVWGVGYIKMDFMESSSVEGLYYRPNTSAIEAQRIGLGIIRDAVGENVILDKDGSAMLAPVGLVDAGRISNDTEHSFQGTFDAATGIAARFYMNRNFYVADPDAFCVSNHRSPDPVWDELKPVTFEEAKAAITLSAMAGGLFEIGDDLPALGKKPERLALLTNPELLKLMQLSRAATPLDLMSYSDEDIQPSIFWIRESSRQGLLAVFNWTESVRSHHIELGRLGIDAGNWQAHEVFGAQGVRIAGRSVIVKQSPHSVRLIRLVDQTIAAIAPEISIQADGRGLVGQSMRLRATSKTGSNPVLNYSWDFGDGTTSEGQQVAHTFTYDDTFTVTLRAQSLDGPISATTRVIKIQGELNTRFSPGSVPAG